MKKLGLILSAILAVITTGCWEKTATRGNEPLWRWHFAGMEAVEKGTNATTLQKIWKLPESVTLREEALTKLAKAPFELWKAKLPAGSQDQATLLRPLIDDLVRAESYLLVRGPSTKPDIALAIRLSSDRAGVWENSLNRLVAAWKLGSPTALPGGVKGWMVTGSKAVEKIQFQRTGDWVILGFGPAKLEALAMFANSVAQSGQPGAALQGKFLELDADLPGLRAWFPILGEYPLPPVHLTVAGSGANLKTEVRLKYGARVPFTYEPWILPTEIITEPLISFTVAQGLAPLLKEFKSVQSLGLKNIPNQFCMWGHENKFPFTYLTVPVQNATNTINQLAQTIPPLAEKIMPKHLGEFLWSSNKALILKDVPFIAPRMGTYRDNQSHYIYAELFPKPGISNRPPAELFAQFKDRKDVLYYDWELTHQRMPHANQLYQLNDIIANRRNIPASSAAQKWIATVSTNLADCITEISLSSPNELKLTRKSQLGFSGFELVGLARWINSKRFPFEYEQSPPMRMSTNPKSASPTPGSNQPKAPSTPPVSTPGARK